MKGQASMEMLVTVSMIIAFTVPVILVLLVSSQIGLEDAALFQAQAATRTLADSINEVYSHGNGSKKMVMVNLPSATNNLTIHDHEVFIEIKTSKGSYQYSVPFYANVSSSTQINGKGLIVLELETKEERDKPVVFVVIKK